MKLGYIEPQEYCNVPAYAAQKHRDWKDGGWQDESFVGKWGPAKFFITHHRQR